MKYTQTFKDHVLARYASGEPIARILNDTGISIATLYDWINKYAGQQKSDEINPNTIRQQQHEYESLQSCVQILQRALKIVEQHPKPRLQIA